MDNILASKLYRPGRYDQGIYYVEIAINQLFIN